MPSSLGGVGWCMLSFSMQRGQSAKLAMQGAHQRGADLKGLVRLVLAGGAITTAKPLGLEIEAR